MIARPAALSRPVWFLLGELVAVAMLEVLPKVLVPRVARRWL